MRFGQLLALQLLTVVGCTADGSGETSALIPHSVRDSAGLEVHSNPTIEAVEQFETGTILLELGASDELPLWNIAGAVPVGDALAIADNAAGRILLVDSIGRVVRSVGGEGEGPGEFRSLGSLWKPADSLLVVFDRELQRLTGISPIGRLAFTTDMEPASLNPPLPLGLIGERTGVVLEVQFDPPASGFAPLRALIKQFNKTGVSVLVDTLTGAMGRVELRRGSFLGSPHFEPGLKATARGNNIWFSTCRTREVGALDSKGTLVSLIRWRGGSLAVDPDDLETYRRLRLRGLDGAERERMAERFDARPASETFPACDALEANSDGELLVRVYRRPGDEHELWLVFLDGQLDRTVQLPVDAKLMWMDSTRVITVEQGELDVEYLRVRELRPVVAK